MKNFKISMNEKKATHRLLLILVLAVLKFSIGLAGDVGQDKILINGTVIDASTNSPMPGVSILVKGTSTGTITDVDGKYSISVLQGQSLIFSFIGYLSKEITVENQTEINISLALDIIGLDEVVVPSHPFPATIWPKLRSRDLIRRCREWQQE
jgi:hypothetical protein